MARSDKVNAGKMILHPHSCMQPYNVFMRRDRRMPLKSGLQHKNNSDLRRRVILMVHDTVFSRRQTEMLTEHYC
ncbi:MAG: hypothetical protein IJH79_18735, partial [Lentisphaeria bacterium]|nr:hypothetical protein [Lentisphaeria bacterium]